ncbi:MAG: hypothetical protein HYV02_00345 [Deltaproteobacteria bacterium]|nr:hypothetical protein [Deltaproteobacteria bacterium]
MRLPAGDTGVPWLTTDDPTPLVYLYPDPLRSTWLVTEGKASAVHAGIRYTKGQVLQRYAYGPFGAATFQLNPDLGAPTPAHAALLTTPSYTGHRALPGVGLLDAHARDLSDNWGWDYIEQSYRQRLLLTLQARGGM